MPQTMQSINDSFCEAMSIIADRAIEKANFDRTLKCNIVKQVDNTNNYICKYQDVTFPVISMSTVAYTNGQNVYVLVPDGDMSNEKIILGSYNTDEPIAPTVYWRTE